jgi:hypothetical protein
LLNLTGFFSNWGAALVEAMTTRDGQQAWPRREKTELESWKWRLRLRFSRQVALGEGGAEVGGKF